MDKYKRRIYEVIEVSSIGDSSSRAYDVLMTTTVIVGLVPLTLKTDNYYTYIIEIMTALILFVDYCARVYTADYKMGFKNIRAYIAYIFTPLAIFDLLSILPVIYLLFPIPSLRLLKLIRIFRVLKLVRYSKTMIVIANVVRKVKTQLIAVLILITIYIFVSAMLIFQLEQNLFDSFFDALICLMILFIKEACWLLCALPYLSGRSV